MSAFGSYLLGALVVAAGLGFGAHLLGVPPVWIAVGVLIIIGASIMAAAAETKQKDMPDES